MYGTWFVSVLAIGMVVLLAIALAAGAFAPLLAAGIALVVGVVLLIGASARRSSQVGAEHATAAEERRQAGQGDRPSASAAPRSGEG
jgi:hypothetical protein